ncbi:hypothetical protein rosmuc_02931 [Roseovarius mucosus DSM 17069]|uniref:GmrSD restriction endonucleases N-terminal domain-containing protein n=1 Tax=Roseovarius mucosus DSM 17069 TaxID=1288298 RepID=A0A0A0HKE3_9RHOB|nr:DUF262 domain-containing protein [Roseovarius mucosus]KGM86638.1 hypothetical protein rosmuc_02931 [Roseovarius mucosus DSM 17069]
MAYEDRDEQFEELEPTEEGESSNVTAAEFSSLLISPTDWTIETLYRQIGSQINLSPEFQRRNVWSSRAKISFIESLFLGIPIPQILLSASGGSSKSFLVLDGKQRLLTIKEFIDGELPSGQKFRLKNLRVLSDLEGQTWEEIEKNEDWRFELLNQTQRTAVIRGWEDDRILYEIFHRLNSGSVKLSPMELRMSLYPGDFLKFIIQWTDQVGPLHELISKKSPDPRMNDVELAARFLAFSDPKLTYAGDLKKFLDELCTRYNTEMAENEGAIEAIKSRLSNMNDAIAAGIEIFPDKKFCRKFVDGVYESRFNRALFDVLVGALANPEVRAWARNNSAEFVNGFEQTSATNAFRRAVETTTKSVASTHTRFASFYAKVSEITGVQLNLPAIANEVTN